MENTNSEETMKTLALCLNRLVLDGYDDDFKINEKGLQSLKTERIYKPEEINVVNFYRFEGQSDPGDNSIMYVIETADGVKGTLVDAYAPYADSRISEFMDQVNSMNKKTEKSASN